MAKKAKAEAGVDISASDATGGDIGGSPPETPASLKRSNYVIALEITTMSPLSHGAGADGNVSIARTSEMIVEKEDPRTGKRVPSTVRVPIVTGSSFRATLREHAFGHMAEVLGLGDGEVSLDALRLLLKGGKNDSGGQTVSLDEARRLRALFPMLAIFGSMDGGMPMRGELRVSQIVPWCTELIESGLVPRTVSGIEVIVDGRAFTTMPQVQIFATREPVPLHMILTDEEYFRHDLRTSPHAHLLPGAARAAIEDKSAARKGKSAGASERREANESMPHTHEAIKAGVPLVAVLRLLGASHLEFECLGFALARWMAHGSLLGGATGKGHGRCAVRVAGAICYDPNPGDITAQPGTEISIDRIGDGYLQHVRARATEIRAELGVVKRGVGATPASGSKKTKVSPLPEDSA